MPAQITGILFSDENKPLANAHIILYTTENQIESFAFSKSDGSFTLRVKKEGNHKVSFRSPYFYPKSVELSIESVNKPLDMGRIELKAVPEQEIKEVVVKRSNPIRYKKDTIEYDIQRFTTGAEQTVEDALKKLPGVSVDSDGRIKVGQDMIAKVLVEGDDIFETGYSILTKNMPAEALEKVQLIYNYSANKVLKGLENSNKTVLNLGLKKKAKDHWFGSLTLASTSYVEKMNQVKANLMNFSTKRKTYMLFNSNNLGLNEMNGVKYLIEPELSTGVESVGSDLQTTSIVSLHQKNNRFKEERTNFNNDRLLSLNHIQNFERNWKLKLVGIYNPIKNRNYVNSVYRFQYLNQEFTNDESKIWRQGITNWVGKIELNKEYGQSALLNLYNKISIIDENNKNEHIFNGAPSNLTGQNKLFSLEHQLTYSQKLDSNRALVAVARYVLQDRPYRFTDESNSFAALFGNKQIAAGSQYIHSKMDFAGVKISLLNKIGDDHNLQFQLAQEMRKDKLFSSLSLSDAWGQDLKIDLSQYNGATNLRQSRTSLNTSYYRKTEHWILNFSLANQLLFSHLKDVQKSGLYVSPMASLNFTPKRNRNYGFNISRNFTSTTISDVFTQYIYQGDRSFQRSDLDFVQMPRLNVGGSYMRGSEIDQALRMNVNYIRSGDYLSNNMIINQDYTQNQKVLVKGQNLWLVHLELRKYMDFLKSRISILNDFTKTDYQSSTNNQPLMKTNSTAYTPGVEIKSGWIKKWNYEIGYKVSFNYSLSEISNRKYNDQKGFFNLYFNPSELLQIKSLFEYYKFGGTHQKSTQFWDIDITYRVPKYNVKFYINAHNLLNSNKISRYSVDNVSESFFTQKLLPRYILLGVDLNF